MTESESEKTTAMRLQELGGPKVRESVNTRMNQSAPFEAMMDGQLGFNAAGVMGFQQDLLMTLQLAYLEKVGNATAADNEFLIDALASCFKEAPFFIALREPETQIYPSDISRVYQEYRDRQHRQWQKAKEKVDQLRQLFTEIYGLENDDALAAYFAVDVMQPLKRLDDVVSEKAAKPFRRTNYKRDRALATEAIWPVLCDLGVSQRSGARIIAAALVEVGMDETPQTRSIRQAILKM